MGAIAISGSASGIGAACADRLAADGHRVIGVDLHDADVIADLGTPEGRLLAVTEVTRRADGSLQGVVTCAGQAGLPSRPGSQVASVNYFGTVALLEGLQPLLAAAADGRHPPAAVAVSSNATTIQPGLPVVLADQMLAGDEAGARGAADSFGSLRTYPATKLAVARWVRARAPGEAWAGAGIRLNAVAPGMVDTPLVAEGRADPEVSPLLDMLPLPVGRAGRPGEIAALVALLVGPDGGFFCGSVLFCDGGTDALLRTGDWPAPWQVDLGSAGSALQPPAGGAGR